MSKEMVILVDENDNSTGVCEKLEAHQKGLLHRAFSVFVFTNENKLILQKRSDKKYHSAGLWTNTCCGHPRPDEDVKAAAQRRLTEEMGIACELQHHSQFTYRTTFKNKLIEHELDHIFIGRSNEIPQLNFDEVSEWKAIGIVELKNDISQHPDNYTYWFKLCVNNIDEMKNKFI
ncbi:MAG: isopentenyl-diphosphate Delta-isomerase [Bacteroidetes bacterium]|nr:isopentenyl-diphosphate Delta-isomerase [Bacteroidota bacterium]